ncbi:SCP1-like small phosphatase 4 [Hibiscus trionum]|uniref:Mitochondrial import inner membrane translocase subunit TIM50 n=1 Tax=Hibiscus trionum TaxID=183268 RepID=A0A9W7LQ10_HIBTR|nr:SCP1-like small phosphatase 4 [Hibiscus trionum]
MPSLRMKTKSSMGSLREKNSLRVCQKSSMICKRPCCHVRVSQQGAELNTCIQNCHDDSSNVEVASQVFETDGASAQQLILDGGDSELQKQLQTFVDSATVGGMESTHTSVSDLETIFSPFLEPIQIHSELNIDNDAGSNDGPELPAFVADDIDGRSSFDSQTCNVSDFFISDMIIASIPFEGNVVDYNISGTYSFPDFLCSEPSMLFDVAEQYMILPFLKDTVNTNYINDVQLHEESMMAQDNTSLCLEIDEMRSCIQESDVNSDSDQAEDFDPQSFIKKLPELSDVVSSFRPANVPTEAWKRKPITLVLDLDETLVHSTLEHCDDADFTFTVFFNMKEHTVYVYRESYIFLDGSYTKDLSVLGVDLAKVAIIDNIPQVFRLQVNNEIPIESWFDDPSDCALISLLSFLETLVDVDDARPIIAKKFGVMMNITRLSANGKNNRYADFDC